MEAEKAKAERKDVKRIGAIIILVISAIVFIPVGGAAVFQSLFAKNKTPVFGTYKGQKIEYTAGSDFAALVANIAQNRENQGQRVTDSDYMTIFQQAFRESIENIYYEDAVKKSGYTVPDNAVNRLILPFYYDDNGVYSQRKYNQTDVGTRTELRKSAEKALTHSRFTNDVLGSSGELYGIKTSAHENEFVTNMGTKRLAFELVAFSTNDLPEEEVKKYAQANADKFVRYDFSAITVSDEKDAKTILKQLQNNEITFEDAVSEKSEQLYTQSDGKLSSPYYYQLQNTVQNEADLPIILGLSKDSLSDVIATKQGFTIFRKDGDFLAANVEDEDTLKVIKNYITSNERGYIENYYTNVAENFRMDALTLKDLVIEQEATREDPYPEPIIIKPFQQACTKYNVSRVETESFPLNYGNVQFYDTMPTSTVTELRGLESDRGALETLFALKEAEISKPIVLGNNVIVARCTKTEQEPAQDEDNYYAQIANYYDSNSAANRIIPSDAWTQFYNAYFEMMYR